MNPETRPSDATLVRRAKTGDERAFAELFERHVETLRRRALRRLPAHLRRRLSTADVIQEIRIAAIRALGDFEPRNERAFRNWVLTIADHKLQDAIRYHVDAQKRAVGREVSRGQRAKTGQFMRQGVSPSQAAVGRETAERIRQAKASLSPDHREILRLVRDEGLSLRDAALRMDRSREAAKKLYGRALYNLREAYMHLEGGSDGAS